MQRRDSSRLQRARPSQAIVLARPFASITSTARSDRAPFRSNDLRPKERRGPSSFRTWQDVRGASARESTMASTDDAGTQRIGRGAPAVVVVGENDQTGGRRRGKPIEISPHRAGEHHARAIVAGKGDRPLARAGGKHRPLGDDLPVALPRLMRRAVRQDDR